MGYFALILVLLVGLSQQQKDPLNDFCRRHGQQSAVIDRKLYLDGGLVNWNPITSNPGNFSNTWLLYNDLNEVGSENMPMLHANLSKNGSIPNVSGGILWPDTINRRFYLYGGEYYQTPPDSYNLLSYDVINNKWDSFGPPNSLVQRTAWGAGCAISERGEGYYYGGWQSNTTIQGWGAKPPAASSSMVKYNMDSKSWTTSTGPDSVPRAEGVMVNIPASDGGLLIYFGGIATPYNTSNTIVGMNMSVIMVYDIASSKWYNQTASGNIPESRRRFCAAATWAADQSSYQIYLYGGLGIPPNDIGFDDVYILSLPTFTWIKFYPDKAGIGSPHHSLTCNIIDGGQMLVIGGTFPLSNDCDAPAVWGTHNLDLGRQNVQNATWYQYSPNITSYVVPPDVIQKIGGTGQGGATLLSPTTWDNRDLPVYFTRKAQYAARTAAAGRTISTSAPASASTVVLPTGAIAGIAVGGGIFLIILLATCIFCLRRHRRKRNANANNPPAGPPMLHISQGQYPPFSPPMGHTMYPTQYGNTWQAPVELAGTASRCSFSNEIGVEHIRVEPKHERSPSETGRFQESLSPEGRHGRNASYEGTPDEISPAYRGHSMPSPSSNGTTNHYGYPSPAHSPDSTRRSTPREAWAELSAHSRSPSVPEYSGGRGGGSGGGGTGSPMRRPTTRGQDYFN